MVRHSGARASVPELSNFPRSRRLQSTGQGPQTYTLQTRTLFISLRGTTTKETLLQARRHPTHLVPALLLPFARSVVFHLYHVTSGILISSQQ